jgi:hypothetical protein
MTTEQLKQKATERLSELLQVHGHPLKSNVAECIQSLVDATIA